MVTKKAAGKKLKVKKDTIKDLDLKGRRENVKGGQKTGGGGGCPTTMNHLVK
jgi:hypothetical protein